MMPHQPTLPEPKSWGDPSSGHSAGPCSSSLEWCSAHLWPWCPQRECCTSWKRGEKNCGEKRMQRKKENIFSDITAEGLKDNSEFICNEFRTTMKSWKCSLYFIPFKRILSDRQVSPITRGVVSTSRRREQRWRHGRRARMAGSGWHCVSRSCLSRTPCTPWYTGQNTRLALPSRACQKSANDSGRSKVVFFSPPPAPPLIAFALPAKSCIRASQQTGSSQACATCLWWPFNTLTSVDVTKLIWWSSAQNSSRVSIRKKAAGNDISSATKQRNNLSEKVFSQCLVGWRGWSDCDVRAKSEPNLEGVKCMDAQNTLISIFEFK